MDFNNNIPIYIQLVDKIKKDIISSKLKPGERMLSVRDLALKVKANPNTIQRALSELEYLKLIYTERTNGKFVTDDDKLIKKYREEEKLKIKNNYISSMKELGFSYEEIIEFSNIKED